jgi:diguanylate cyclase (GGDEF)-like protein
LSNSLDRSRLKWALAAALLLLCAQSVSIGLTNLAWVPDSTPAFLTAYLFLFIPPCCAMVVCFQLARQRGSLTRATWGLVAAGLALWCAGVALSAWADLSGHSTDTVASAEDLTYFLYGVPILLAISLPAANQRLKLFAVIDGLQVLIAGVLVYIQIFGVIPFTTTTQPVPVNLLVRTYNLENLMLAVAASIRLLAGSGPAEEKRFFRMLAAFLWCYALCSGVYNALELEEMNQIGPHDMLPGLPFLMFALLAYAIPKRSAVLEDSARSQSGLAIFIENGSPILFSFALLALGASIARTNFAVGISAISLALVLYGVRATLLQSRYIASQIALRSAKERVEQLSLQDALTGIANRRHFDQAVEVEWRRAVRSSSPLSLLLLDVDFFKRLNDEFGHRRGDAYLVEIASALQGCVRTGDLMARYGGEEFAAILPGTGRKGAENVAARMQSAVRDIRLAELGEGAPRITISIGVSIVEAPHAGTYIDMIDASDRALYAAKRAGRDRIEFADSLEPVG